MVEELYVYAQDGSRISLDLNSPSGITLKWVSNLFNSLDKVSCSYSYTFKLPMTRRNREALLYAEDIRHKADMAYRRVKAEFIQNGIPLFGNANLYITKVTSTSYSCVLTWGVVDGLETLKDEGGSLNELRDALKDTIISVSELNNFTDWNSLMYTDEVAKHYNNESQIIKPNYGIQISDPSYTYDEDSSKRLNRTGFSQGVPKPAIPVRYLINCINKAYGTKINIGNKVDVDCDSLPSRPLSSWIYENDNIVDYGVIPLTGIELTDEQQSERGVTLTMEGTVSYCLLGTERYLYFTKPIDIDIITDVLSDHQKGIHRTYWNVVSGENIGNFPSSLSDVKNYYAHDEQGAVLAANDPYKCIGITTWKAIPVKMRGKFCLSFDAPKLKMTNDFYDKVKFKVYSWTVNNFMWTDENVCPIEVASFEPTSIESGVADNDGEYRYIFYFNFNPSEGYEEGTFQNEEMPDAARYVVHYWFGFSNEIFTEGGFIWSGQTIKFKGLTFIDDLTFTPNFNDVTEYPHIIDTFTNLPDIDCLAFVKSLFYIEGGFPKVSKDGEIGIAKYSDIKKNIGSGNVYDWSRKVMSFDEYADETEFEGGSFHQNNYYLNKWDDLDRTAQDLEDEDDIYEDGVGNIVCDNKTLDKEQTVHQIPFYPPYILNRKYPLETDHTVKSRKYDLSQNKFSINDRGELFNSNKMQYIEMKPVYGIVHFIPPYSGRYEGYIAKNANYYGYYIRMAVLNPFKDILMNPSYRYLQEIVKTPVTITENLLLDEMDVVDLDYTKPIYIEKYNSHFAIISIQRNSKGVYKCELLKLPVYKPTIKITLTLEEQLEKFLHFTVTSSATLDHSIMIGFILTTRSKNEQKYKYVMYSKIFGDMDNAFQQFNPGGRWDITDVWLDHREEGDYNDYEFSFNTNSEED